MEEEMATHSSVLAWRIPGTGEPGGLSSMRLHRVRHDWSDLAAAAVLNLGNFRLLRPGMWEFFLWTRCEPLRSEGKHGILSVGPSEVEETSGKGNTTPPSCLLFKPHWVKLQLTSPSSQGEKLKSEGLCPLLQQLQPKRPKLKDKLKSTLNSDYNIEPKISWEIKTIFTTNHDWRIFFLIFE